MSALVIAIFVHVAIVLDVAGKKDMMEIPILAAMDVTVTVTHVVVIKGAS